MKGNKAPDATIEVSPSQKKLKQARLPFKLISEVPSPDTPQTRKRKLSAQDIEVAPKIGKLAKENDVVEDLVLISDDSNDKQALDSAVSLANPYVKLVSKAIKKKQQKKTPKKKKSSKNNNVSSHKKSTETSDEKCEKSDEEAMDVDEEASATKSESIELNENLKENEKLVKTDEEQVSENDSASDKVVPETSKVIDLDDESDYNADISISEKEKDKSSSSDKTETTEKPTTTPKRSSRIKHSQDEKDKLSRDSSQTSSKLDESVSSVPSTPKTPKRTQGSVTNTGDESLNDSTSLTPKQQQKKLESAKKREEREKEKQEREKKRQQEKEERDKIKKDKEDQKRKEREEKEEAKKKEREEKEEQKKKEREEKEKQRELDKKLREEKEELKRKEREEKEEQRKKEKEARDEEKRKRQEAAEQEKQDQELKKKKAAEAFANFFVPKQKTDKDQAIVGPVIHNNMLSRFTIKADMRLAPTVRLELSEDRKKTLESLIKTQNVAEQKLYVKSLKDGVKTGSCGKTWPLEDKDDVVIIEDELQPLADIGEVIAAESTVQQWRPKLLSFHENRRPPYWGTWRRKSVDVRARRPFGRDQKHLDYDIDSDDEWEEEAEGESIDGSAAGSDVEENDEYEVDNEVFVPHGYLSDEEATMDEDDVLALSPEAQAAKLKHLEDEFESEMKKPTEKLKPRLYGPIWETPEGGKPEKCVDALWNYFGRISMIMDDPTPLLQPAPVAEETEKKKNKKKKQEKKETEGESPKSEKKKKAKPERKDKKPDEKKSTPEVKKSQLGINSFLTKLKTT